MTAKTDVFLNYARSVPHRRRVIDELPAGTIYNRTALVLPFPTASAAMPKDADGADNQPVIETRDGSRMPSTLDGGTHEPPTSERPKRLITLTELLKRVPVSRQTIFDWEQHGSFPRRVILPNGRGYWLEHEIDEWIEADSRKRRHDND